MPGAWVDSYWLSYRPRLGGLSITFHGWTDAGMVFTAYLDVTEAMSFEVIKTQLNHRNIYVDWDSSTHQVYRIIVLKQLE
jgi:hypothetical protein